MAKISAAAVVAAIKQLSARDLGPEEEAFVEVYLTGKRLQALGQTPSINTVNSVVRELFLVLPTHDFGRLQPFTKPSLGGANRRRGWIANIPDSGRSTVWNAGTRTNSKSLCEGDSIKNGLRANASSLFTAKLTGGGTDSRPQREALLVFLLRNHDFGTGTIDLPALEARATVDFKLSAADLAAVTRNRPLGVPLVGVPEWDPSQLPIDVAPVSSTTAAMEPSSTVYTRGAVAVPTPLHVDPKVRRMVRRAIASAHAVLLVGPPGTGKTSLLHEVSTDACANPERYNLGAGDLPPPTWITAEEGWTARDLVGGESIVDGEVVFRPGSLLRAIEANRWLVIDELNRADMDRIFGPIFTWLSGGDVPPVSLGRRSAAHGEPEIELHWSDARDCAVEGAESLQGGVGEGEEATTVKYRAGTSWRLLGTYNAVDAQRVFRVGQALGRRFLRVPIPPVSVDQFRDALASTSPDLDTTLHDGIVELYGAHLDAIETALGPALFLRIAEYVAAATELAVIEEDDDGEGVASSALVEGYLVNVGAWLARLETDQLDALGVRVKAPNGPFEEEAWEWLRSMIPNLG